MRIVLQRVSSASVSISGEVVGAIEKGFLALVGIEDGDGEEDLRWLANKLVRMRVFADESGKMNVSLLDTGGDLLAISQFTLHASTQKGNRPSFVRSAAPDTAARLYADFVGLCETLLGRPVQTGRFGANMQVSLVNDGPVTILLDSKDRE